MGVKDKRRRSGCWGGVDGLLVRVGADQSLGGVVGSVPNGREGLGQGGMSRWQPEQESVAK